MPERPACGGMEMGGISDAVVGLSGPWMLARRTRAVDDGDRDEEEGGHEKDGH